MDLRKSQKSFHFSKCFYIILYGIDGGLAVSFNLIIIKPYKWIKTSVSHKITMVSMVDNGFHTNPCKNPLFGMCAARLIMYKRQ